MKVFISYSTSDLNLVKNIDTKLHGLVETKYWDKSKEVGEKDWDTINSWIDQSHLVLIILSESSKNNPSVRTEIGRAHAKSKALIPFVSNKVSTDELGSLKGITYVPYDEENPEKAQPDLIKAIQSQKAKIESGNGLMVLAVLSLVLIALGKSE